MTILDPRLGLLAAGAAVIGSERVRRTVGRGAGYAVAGVMKVGGPVIAAGQEIVEEARETAGSTPGGRSRKPRRRSSSRR